MSPFLEYRVDPTSASAHDPTSASAHKIVEYQKLIVSLSRVFPEENLLAINGISIEGVLLQSSSLLNSESDVSDVSILLST